MERHEPMLYVGCGERLRYVGIHEMFASGKISEQRVAINALLALAHKYEQGEQLDNDPNGMIDSEHHWYGGHQNAPIIAENKIARGFYCHPLNRDYIRRDVHTFIEREYGWPVLPSEEDMARFLQEEEGHISSRLYDALEEGGYE